MLEVDDKLFEQTMICFECLALYFKVQIIGYSCNYINKFALPNIQRQVLQFMCSDSFH